MLPAWRPLSLDPTRWHNHRRHSLLPRHPSPSSSDTCPPSFPSFAQGGNHSLPLLLPQLNHSTWPSHPHSPLRPMGCGPHHDPSKVIHLKQPLLPPPSMVPIRVSATWPMTCTRAPSFVLTGPLGLYVVPFFTLQIDVSVFHFNYYFYFVTDFWLTLLILNILSYSTFSGFFNLQIRYWYACCRHILDAWIIKGAINNMTRVDANFSWVSNCFSNFF